MTTGPVRASAGWLGVREPADAVARSSELARTVADHLARDSTTRVHDLGSGTGSMTRWLAPRLPGPQHWVLYDRDSELLAETAAQPVPRAADGTEVTLETRSHDITRLEPGDLAGADLVTASALLDMLTAAELDRLVDTCVDARCPALITLSVVGRAELTPRDPFDLQVMKAFNAHQRRATGAGRLLGPDALGTAVHAFTGLGLDVITLPSPWRLGPNNASWRRSGSPAGWPRLANKDPSWARRARRTPGDALPRQPAAGCRSPSSTRTCWRDRGEVSSTRRQSGSQTAAS